MAVVNVAILEPSHGAQFAGTGAVRLRGSVPPVGHNPLFFKWYSSLNAPTDPANVALNGPADNPLDFTVTLKVGSHVLTFTGKDVESDAPDALKGVQDAGMAGGPPAAQAPCIINVFLANMVQPASDGLLLSKSNAVLEAEAPVKWGRKSSGGTVEPDPDYQAINRIRYRWRFRPAGPPAGRHEAELAPAAEDLTFAFGASASDPPTVQYQGPLPGALDTGLYILTLRVEDTQASAVGHEASRSVVIAA